MKYSRTFILLGLLLPQAAKARDAKFSQQVLGTWTRGPFSWVEPPLYSKTFSPDGSFTTSIGHTNALVIYQGTWLVKGGELVMTTTNTHGTGNHQPGPVGGVDRVKIIHLNDHQFIYEAGGKTNSLTR